MKLDGVRGVGSNGIGDGFVTVIGTSHGDSMLSGFVKLQRAEARLKINKFHKEYPAATE